MPKQSNQASSSQVLQTASLQRRLDASLKEEEIQKKIDKEIGERLPKLVEQEVGQALSSLKSDIRREAKSIANESFEDVRQKIEKDRLNTIQATSIVTIFIGFLVVQFNILQGHESVSDLAGLSLILLSSIIIFTLLLDLVIKLDLPYKKTRIIKGAWGNGITQLAQAMGGNREVEVQLTWKPSTWGEGLIIRAFACGIAILLGIAGVLLITLWVH